MWLSPASDFVAAMVRVSYRACEVETCDITSLHDPWNAPKPLDVARDKSYKAYSYIVEGRIYVD